MILTLKNIGKISDATIELKGITVIAGENNTGKSTLGKVLFCVFNSFNKIDQRINNERQSSIQRILLREERSEKSIFIPNIANADEIAYNILQNKEAYINKNEMIQEQVKGLYLKVSEPLKEYLDTNFFESVSEKINEVLNISDEEIFKIVLQKKLESEFNHQINNIYNSGNVGEICLKIQESEVEILVEDDEVKQIANSYTLNTEVVYIDDPFVLDDLNSRYVFRSNDNTHRQHLESKILTDNNASNVKDAINEIIISKKMKNIFAKINSVCSGEMVSTGRSGFGYKRSNSDKVLDVKNISTGLKTFVIIKTLLLNGCLEENGTIVLDEPEIHLHPEWQLLFAELIILIQKEFGMHILLNTHSPYFLNAIEVYAAKYEISDKCKYYLAKNIDTKAVVEDVSSNIEKIYEKLARPLQELENERYDCD